MRVAVIGSTGYVGTRLVGRLLDEGHRVTALVRSPAKLAATGWAGRVDVVHGDLAEPAAVGALVEGADVVHHLAHGLDRPDFPERDRAAAHTVADAADAAGVSRLVYLGGMRPVDGVASRHLASRAEVADVFLASPVPTVALEASVIVGSGSASFEVIRYLAERAPVLPAIPWLAHRTQPVAVADVLHQLTAAMDVPAAVDRRFDLAGPDVLTYLDLVQRFARLAGLPQRIAVPLPVPVPPGGATLAAYLLDLLSPLSHRLVEPLIESLAHELVADPESLAALDEVVGAPPGGRTTFDAAVRAALGVRPDGADPDGSDPAAADLDGPDVDGTDVDGSGVAGMGLEGAARGRTTRGGTGPAPAERRDPALAVATDPAGSGGSVYRWRASVDTGAPPSRVWRAVTALGGDTGWHTLPGVWAARGWADQLLGGVGAYRGRPRGRDLRVGDVVDGWRVESLVAGRRLAFRSDERVPGRLGLVFTVTPRGEGSRLDLQVWFAPSGLAGVVYGRALRAGAPLVFGPMARGVVAAAT